MTTLSQHRAPSPNLPRPSTSSNRSYRRSGVDFESALLNTNETIYLSTSQPIGEEPETPSSPTTDMTDAPQPVEKLSFDEEMRRKSTPVKGVLTPTVVPPTPLSSSRKSDKRISHIPDPSKNISPMKSLGLDAELSEGAATLPSKRRSIFRSPGTASSPDLATLVRKAKEARAAGQVPTVAAQAAEAAVKKNPVQHIPSSSSPSRSRAVSHSVSRGDDGWERYPNGDLKSLASDRMATVTESPKRSRQGSGDDSFKTIRNKAKGMLGRMFGSKETTSPSRTQSTTERSPPVPPLPITYTREADKRRTPPMNDVFGTVRVTSPKRRISENSQTDKPLPDIQEGLDKPLPMDVPLEPVSETSASAQTAPTTPSLPAAETPPPKRASLHTRQPAGDSDTTSAFSEDLAGMLDGIGQTEPAKELGLSPASLRLNTKLQRADSDHRVILGRSFAPSIPSHRTSSLSSPRLEPSPKLEPSPQIRTASTPSPVITDKEETPSVRLVSPRPESEPETVETIATPPIDDEERGRRLACEFLENDYTHVAADKVAIFLGGPRPVNTFALRYYMQYFDMKGQKLDAAFRDLCQKLHLKAESQEIDRIIEGFSARYFECNPNTVFGTSGVVHTVTAAMLMLNTDLHIAELAKHMTRADFVRNALRAIQESMPGSSTPDLIHDDSSGRLAPSVRTRPESAQRSISAPVTMMNDSTTTVSSFSYNRSWEMDAENALKEIYANVRTDRILLPIDNRLSMVSVIGGSGGLGRRGTIRSPNQSNDRIHTLKRNSMRMGNNPYGMASDGRLSPTPSYATSINEGFASFTQSLGFASNLSHSVIREHDDEVRSIDSHHSTSTTEDMDDDELALFGAPWAKEGILSRKLYWEAAGRRSKTKDWRQFFVVIQRGDLYMFVFGEGSNTFGGTVGGGNWMNNAKATGELSLMHSMAVALPRPGYSATRPYCFSLALPSGETSFFQAGTEDLVSEWVATCNYWAARTSRQPLQGGVSNMEYGWNRVDQDHDQDHDDDHSSVKSGRSNLSKLNSYRRSQQPSEKWIINDWKPPPVAGMASSLDEENQLEALQNYLRSLRNDLDKHKSLEEGMSKLYLPRSTNGSKAKENWRAKFHYIQSEIYKYETYVDALKSAISLRVKKQGEKKLEKSLQRSMSSLHREDLVDGEEEPTTPTRLVT